MTCWLRSKTKWWSPQPRCYMDWFMSVTSWQAREWTLWFWIGPFPLYLQSWSRFFNLHGVCLSSILLDTVIDLSVLRFLHFLLTRSLRSAKTLTLVGVQGYIARGSRACPLASQIFPEQALWRFIVRNVKIYITQGPNTKAVSFPNGTRGCLFLMAVWDFCVFKFGSFWVIGSCCMAYDRPQQGSNLYGTRGCLLLMAVWNSSVLKFGSLWVIGSCCRAYDSSQQGCCPLEVNVPVAIQPMLYQHLSLLNSIFRYWRSILWNNFPSSFLDELSLYQAS